MLRSLRGGTLPALAFLVLAGCSRPPAIEPGPLDIEAAYRLLFNDALVGDALFTVQIHADGGYRIEAFTTPSGKMQRAAGHEVFESSEGAFAHGRVRPRRFDHSEMADGEITVFSQVFDWDARALQLDEGERARTLALADDTQDRLSYLLLAHALARAGEGEAGLLITGPQGNEEVRLEVGGQATVETPAGRYRTTLVRRTAPHSEETRSLWFDVDLGPLPVKVLHRTDGNTVEMVLETFTRAPSDPR